MVFIPPLKIGDYSLGTDSKLGYYYVALALLVASTIFLRWMVRGSVGLGIVALRDFEDYAVSRGISIAWQRLLVLMASAIFTGTAGGLYTLYLRVASPEVFGFDFLTLILSMVLVGGLATIYGPILGAIVLVFVSEAMFAWGPWRYMVNAALMIAVILFFPGGILGILKGAVRPLLARYPRDGGTAPIATTAGRNR
jgi:branched-chain amino acid transport system permease protein